MVVNFKWTPLSDVLPDWYTLVIGNPGTDSGAGAFAVWTYSDPEYPWFSVDFYGTGSTFGELSAGGLELDVEHDVTVTVASNGTRVYIDGVLRASGPTTMGVDAVGQDIHLLAGVGNDGVTPSTLYPPRDPVHDVEVVVPIGVSDVQTAGERVVVGAVHVEAATTIETNYTRDLMRAVQVAALPEIAVGFIRDLQRTADITGITHIDVFGARLADWHRGADVTAVSAIAVNFMVREPRPVYTRQDEGVYVREDAGVYNRVDDDGLYHRIDDGLYHRIDDQQWERE
jgi:hypothetical protein